MLVCGFGFLFVLFRLFNSHHLLLSPETDMLIITMCRVSGPKRGSSVDLVKSSDLIDTSPTIRFFLSYAPFPLYGRLEFKVYCRQIGEDGKKAKDLPLIEIIIPNITEGPTVEQFSSFLQKFIMVECGLWFQYESHSCPGEDYVDINKWGALFTNFPNLISVHLQYLDEALGKKKIILSHTQLQISKPSVTVGMAEIHSSDPQLVSIERKYVPPPPVPQDSCLDLIQEQISLPSVQSSVPQLESESLEISNKRKHDYFSPVRNTGMKRESPSFKQTLVASIDEGGYRKRPFYFDVLTSNEITTSVRIKAGPGLQSSFGASVTNTVRMSVPTMMPVSSSTVDPLPNQPSGTKLNASAHDLDLGETREPLGELPQYYGSFDHDPDVIGFGI